jgi:hypothetical protein
MGRVAARHEARGRGEFVGPGADEGVGEIDDAGDAVAAHEHVVVGEIGVQDDGLGGDEPRKPRQEPPQLRFQRLVSAPFALIDDEALEALGEQGAVALVLDPERDTEGSFACFLEESPRVREWQRDGRWRVFLLSHQPRRAAAAVATVPIARVRSTDRDEDTAAMLDGDIRTRWTSDRPQTGDEAVEAQLTAERPVAGVVLSIGRSQEDYPRRLAIETSRDDREWAPAGEATGYAPAMRAALRDPRAVPMRFDFPPRMARLVRLRQTGRDERMWWSIAELEVVGPGPQARVVAEGWQAGHQ